MDKEMRISHVMELMKETGLSPEDLGERIGVSGMTIRRWARRSPDEVLSSLYADATRWAIYGLVVDGRISSRSQSANWAFATTDAMAQKARLVACGFPSSGESGTWDEGEILRALERLGENSENQETVNSKRETIESYRSLGSGWQESIGVTVAAITKTGIPQRARAIAYGALCYLLFPFDLIPDSLAIVGLVDDFSMLSMATAYCQKVVTDLT